MNLDNFNANITVEGNDIHFLAPQVFLLGMPSSGKTSLVNKLINSNNDLAKPYDGSKCEINYIRNIFYNEEINSTVGYHIVDFDRPFIEINMWKMFISVKCLYVIVIDSAANYEKDSIEYWFGELIKYCNDGKQVFLVQNLTNNSSVQIIDRLADEYKKILHENLYEFNLNDIKNVQYKDNFLRFKEDLEKELLSRSIYIKKNNKLLNLLNNIKLKKIFSIEEYKNICVDNHILNYEEQMGLLHKINMLGFCLWYENIGVLKRIIIRDKAWLYKAIFALFKNPKSEEQKWRFSFSTIEKIWKTEDYRDCIYDLLLISENHNVIYQIDKTHNYVFPNNLNKNALDSFDLASIKDAKICFINKYGKPLPQDFIIHLLVIFYPQISGNQNHVWGNGLKINSVQGPEAVGVIELSYDNRTLRIWANGAGAGFLIQQILCELWKLHNKIGILPEKQILPCNCLKCYNSSKLKEFEYEEVLIEIFKNRRSGIRCPYKNDDIPFENLIGILSTHNHELTKEGEAPQKDKKNKFIGKSVILQLKLIFMKKYPWAIILPIAIVTIGVFFLRAKPGSKLKFLDWFTAEQGKEDASSTPIIAPAVLVPIKINGTDKEFGQIGFMRSVDQLTKTAPLGAGGVFQFNQLEIPSTELLQFELFSKEGKSLATATANYKAPNAKGVSSLDVLMFTGEFNRKNKTWQNLVFVKQEVKVNQQVGKDNSSQQK